MNTGRLIQRWLALTLLVFATLIVSVSASHAAPTLEAHVDRTAIEAGDSLTLTLRINDTGTSEPNLKALEKDFAVLGVSTGSGIEASIGRMQRWTEWQIALSPLRSGNLTIPALTIDGARSNPIAIKVGESNSNDSSNNNSNSPIIIEASLDHDAVYVQQQTLLTVRVYNAIALDRMNITEPEFDNATVRKLAQRNSQIDRNGQTYQLHELVYAIFPQKSGDLTIPELVFTATEAQQARALFDFPRPGRSVRKLSRQLTLRVKPVPAQFTGKVWLPARHLTAQETWGGNPQTISVGNSITRAIALQADGLMAAQLPALDAPTLDNAKLYADQPALDDQADDAGMHGKRTETTALIPAREGLLQLPEVRVHWWDLDSDSEKVATIPAETLTILPGSTPAAANTSPTSVTPEVKPADGGTPKNTAATPLTSTASDSATSALQQPQVRIWVAISTLLFFAWLVTLWLYWRALQSTRSEKPQIKSVSVNAISDDNLLRNAIDAANLNDARTTHTLVTRWIRQHYPQTPTLAQWFAAAKVDTHQAALADAIEALQRYLYSAATNSDDAGNYWNGAELARLLTQIGKVKKQSVDKSATLPSLYPST